MNSNEGLLASQACIQRIFSSTEADISPIDHEYATIFDFGARCRVWALNKAPTAVCTQQWLCAIWVLLQVARVALVIVIYRLGVHLSTERTALCIHGLVTGCSRIPNVCAATGNGL